MKHNWMASTALALFLGSLTCIAGVVITKPDMTKKERDKEGHVLVSLWDALKKEQKADKPASELKILTQIKEEALAKRYSWDYYEACKLYVSTSTRRNWKLRGQCLQDFDNEVTAYCNSGGDPIMVLYHDYSTTPPMPVQEYAAIHRDRLESSRNVEFYHGRFDGDTFGKLLVKNISNDWEFWHWSRALKGGWNSRDKEYDGIVDSLRLMIGGRYPEEAILDWEMLDRRSYASSDEMKHMESLANKYKGHAAELIFLARMSKTEMQNLQEKGTEQQYKDLYKEFELLKEKAQAFKTSEPEFYSHALKQIERAMDGLTDSHVWCSAKDGRMKVFFHNAESTEISIVKGKAKVFKGICKNPKNSFYVVDMVEYALPDLEDGEYEVRVSQKQLPGKKKKEDELEFYSKYSLSAAICAGAVAPAESGAGWLLYLADLKDGFPVDSATLVLGNSKGILAEAEWHATDGFGPLPEEFVRHLRGMEYGYWLECKSNVSGRVIKTNRISVPVHRNGVTSSSGAGDETNVSKKCVVVKNCSLFHPGDSFEYKLIAYNEYDDGHLEVMPKGENVEVVMIGPDGKQVHSSAGKTGKTGALHGKFDIPEELKRGTYRMEAYQLTKNERNYLGSSSFVVEEAVLPSFRLVVDPVEGLFFAGDSVRFTGRVETYSGRSLHGAALEWKLRSNGVVSRSGKVVPASDGSFSVVVGTRDDDSGRVQFHASLTDGAGETQEASTSIYLKEYVSITAKALNVLAGRCEDGYSMVSNDSLSIDLGCFDEGGRRVEAQISYKILKEGKEQSSGMLHCASGTHVLNLCGQGLYKIEFSCKVADQSGKVHKGETSLAIMRVCGVGEKFVGCTDLFVVKEDAEYAEGHDAASNTIAPSVLIGAGQKPMCVAALAYDQSGRIMEYKVLRLKACEVYRYSLAPVVCAPGRTIGLELICFQGEKVRDWSMNWTAPERSIVREMSFSRFTDSTFPGGECSYAIDCWSGAELAVAVFDQSTEVYASNEIRPLRARSFPVYSPYTRTCAGCNSFGVDSYIYDEMVTGFGAAKSGDARMLLSVRNMAAVSYEAMATPDCCEESGIDMDDADEFTFREDFADILAFLPEVPAVDDNRSGGAVASFRFNASDKLSTYVVQVFAHDSHMNNAVVRETMKVTLPVQLTLNPPQFLYAGDCYEAAVAVSNVSDSDIDGIVKATLSVGDSIFAQGSIALVAKAGGESSCRVDFGEIPQFEGLKDSDMELTLSAAFSGTTPEGLCISDGVKKPILLKPSSQILTETHSAVLLHEADRKALEDSLAAAFTGTSAYGAEWNEISISQMLQEVLDSKAVPAHDNIVDLTASIVVRGISRSLSASHADVDLASNLDSELIDKIVACCCADGGFSWFPGMESSAMLTALTLERFSFLRMRGLLPASLESKIPSAIKYLDKNQFDKEARKHHENFWNHLSLDRYLHVRSLYCSEPLACSPDKDARKAISEYLTPTSRKGVSLKGDVFGKTLRLSTLIALTSSRKTESGKEVKDGQALAKSLGLSSLPAVRTLRSDAASLKEYVVRHPSGAWYSPNLVMPFRALLEGELYAHTLLCGVLSSLEGDSLASEQAEGIRLWLMLQKETQKWESDVASVEAVAAVHDGSSALLDTRVITAKKTYLTPLSEIKAASNGMRISSSLSVYRDGSFVTVEEGMMLQVGDKLRMDCKVWSEENRSLGIVTITHPANMLSCEQLSGYRWRFYGCYREVTAEAIKYWCNVLPEETSEISEEFVVTQAGRFNSKACVAECAYADHYRANDSASSAIVSK